jgi:hypothetical protein
MNKLLKLKSKTEKKPHFFISLIHINFLLMSILYFCIKRYNISLIPSNGIMMIPIIVFIIFFIKLMTNIKK